MARYAIQKRFVADADAAGECKVLSNASAAPTVTLQAEPARAPAGLRARIWRREGLKAQKAFPVLSIEAHGGDGCVVERPWK